MKKHTAALTLVLIALLAGRANADEPLTFEQHVRPILKAYCLDCHGAGEKLKGGLDLRLKRFAEKGGKSGSALVAGSPDRSPLLQRMKLAEMPTTQKKVPAELIAVVEKWIAAGARANRVEPTTLPPGIDITPEERAYWFYQPLRPAEPAKFGPNDRVRTPIDAFVLAKLRDKKLSFQEDADRLTLIRRASLDLLGLPPSQKEIDAFLADTAPDAYEKLLDRLLASPHYGERWARHWLDVVGYADSAGDGVADTARPYAWKYRDYVIRSLNADKPLNQFIVEQLAGDELTPGPWNNLKPEQIERLVATGYLRCAPDPTASKSGQAEAEQVVVDTLKIVGSSLLGMSVGCAQCHDHRYDPIPQADYFRLRAVFEPAFNPAQWRGAGQRRVSLFTDADRAKAAAIEAEATKLQAVVNLKQQEYVDAAFEKELTKFPEGQRAALRAAFKAVKKTPEQTRLVDANPKLKINGGVLYQFNQKAADEIKKMQDGVNAKRALKPIEDFIDITNEVPGQVPLTKIFHRGDYRQPKDAVQPGDLTIAAPEGKRFEIAPTESKTKSSTGRRLAFARHLTSGDHPLLGRVLVNRIWQHHFGRGIVNTPGDFGVLGERPSHPELLDWLALELVRQGWSMKKMHKLIMTSTAYRQSARRTTAHDAVDGSNALLGRYSLRRLDAEVLRDRILLTAGRLDRTPFGPPVAVVEDAVGQGNAPDDKPRRSIYLQVRRTKPVAFLAAFDAPTAELNCDRRVGTTSAPQALMLMNSDFILKQAGHFAARVRKETPADFDRARLDTIKTRHPRLVKYAAFAWREAYQRSASLDELAIAAGFLDRQMDHLRANAKDVELAALTNLCQQLLSSNEFLHVD
ncbi:MAG TPA: PSD1 and planctomycete cytochrome C domain-containing protein [Gemmataceae bacterium]|nr:PSD1 and planctomycete cytochrome C domain-containing protein [Gemmataceae bacterium]